MEEARLLEFRGFGSMSLGDMGFRFGVEGVGAACDLSFLVWGGATFSKVVSQPRTMINPTAKMSLKP